MCANDQQYFRDRAVAERELAQSAPAVNIAMIHEELARNYEQLSEQPELSEKLRIVLD